MDMWLLADVDSSDVIGGLLHSQGPDTQNSLVIIWMISSADGLVADLFWNEAHARANSNLLLSH